MYVVLVAANVERLTAIQEFGMLQPASVPKQYNNSIDENLDVACIVESQCWPLSNQNYQHKAVISPAQKARVTAPDKIVVAIAINQRNLERRKRK